MNRHRYRFFLQIPETAGHEFTQQVEKLYDDTWKVLTEMPLHNEVLNIGFPRTERGERVKEIIEGCGPFEKIFRKKNLFSYEDLSEGVGKITWMRASIIVAERFPIVTHLEQYGFSAPFSASHNPLNIGVHLNSHGRFKEIIPVRIRAYKIRAEQK